MVASYPEGLDLNLSLSPLQMRYRWHLAKLTNSLTLRLFHHNFAFDLLYLMDLFWFANEPCDC